MRKSRQIEITAPVSSFTVAPHRYTYDSDIIDGEISAMSLREFRALAPYVAGEVVYIEHNGEARLAYIHAMYVDYTHNNERRHKYRVTLANRTGDRFSKVWFYTWPGYIQRGYKLAGLAPDMKD